MSVCVEAVDKNKRFNKDKYQKVQTKTTNSQQPQSVVRHSMLCSAVLTLCRVFLFVFVFVIVSVSVSIFVSVSIRIRIQFMPATHIALVRSPKFLSLKELVLIGAYRNRRATAQQLKSEWSGCSFGSVLIISLYENDNNSNNLI